MAVRKKTGEKSTKKTKISPAKGRREKKPSASPTGKGKSQSWAILFWLAFAIFIFGFFIFNREAISASIVTIKKEFAARKTQTDEKPALPLTTSPVPPASGSLPASPPAATPPAAPVASKSPVSPTPVTPAPVTPAPATSAPTTSAPSTPDPAASPAPPQSPRPPAEQRERVLYFTQVDKGGSILRVKVNRKLPVSDSPMTDVIQALISGPNGEEKSKGLISLIPPNTRILSATVRGDTAYISFSEDFQYNTYGVEGYAGQLRQVVFTVTEFANVKDVQILIEGRRIDYLGEGVWIGSPLSRDML